MDNNYKNVVFIHANDKTTEFLNVFKKLSGTYLEIKPNINSIRKCLQFTNQLEASSLIVFLGHGHSQGLYSPQSSSFKRQIIIDAQKANVLFKDHDVLLLCCNSNEFIRKFSSYRKIMGFGNILSSFDEIKIESEYTGIYRDLNQADIDSFNQSYTLIIFELIQALLEKKIQFEQLPDYIRFKANKKINSVLKLKNKKNKTEISKLLFEFRNELVYKDNSF